MKKVKSEKGQAIVLIALAMVGLIALTALTIDGGRVLSDRRNAQNAADTSALAAALAKIQGKSDYKTYATNRASSNGYANDADSAVEVDLCSEVSGANACQGLPTGATTSQYIRVRITSTINTTFAKVIGRSQLTNIVEAVTRVQGSFNPGTSWGSAGMVATKNDSSNQCFLINGNANIILHDETGLFVNCTGDEALFINGGADVNAGGDLEVAGCANNQGGNLTGTGTIQCNQDQQIVDQSTFASVPRALPTPSCPTPAATPTIVGNTKTFHPGNYPSSQTVNSNQTGALEPGTYCFAGGLNINGQGTLQGSGAVRIVLGNNSLNLNNATTFEDVEIYLQNGTVSVKGDFTASQRLRFFATGTGGMDIQSGTFYSPNAYLYTYDGNIQLNAQSKLDLHAPPENDTFHGLLIHYPWNSDTSNDNAFILNGATDSILFGTIMVPKSDVTYNGGSHFTLHGQVIGSTFKVNGSGQLDIYFEPGYPLDTGEDPTITIDQ